MAPQQCREPAAGEAPALRSMRCARLRDAWRSPGFGARVFGWRSEEPRGDVTVDDGKTVEEFGTAPGESPERLTVDEDAETHEVGLEVSRQEVSRLDQVRLHDGPEPLVEPERRDVAREVAQVVARLLELVRRLDERGGLGVARSHPPKLGFLIGEYSLIQHLQSLLFVRMRL